MPDAGALSLSAVEQQLSRFLHSPLDYVHPTDIARKILEDRYGSWAQERDNGSVARCRVLRK